MSRRYDKLIAAVVLADWLHRFRFADDGGKRMVVIVMVRWIGVIAKFAPVELVVENHVCALVTST